MHYEVVFDGGYLAEIIFVETNFVGLKPLTPKLYFSLVANLIKIKFLACCLAITLACPYRPHPPDHH
jgi:hypothetical protein